MQSLLVLGALLGESLGLMSSSCAVVLQCNPVEAWGGMHKDVRPNLWWIYCFAKANEWALYWILPEVFVFCFLRAFANTLQKASLWMTESDRSIYLVTLLVLKSVVHVVICLTGLNEVKNRFCLTRHSGAIICDYLNNSSIFFDCNFTMNTKTSPKISYKKE